MTREEAIKIVRNIYQTDAEKEALGTLIPELRESEDERIRKAIMGLTYIDGIEPILTKCSITAQDIRKYLEKQKENIEKEYVFRPLAGTDITIAAEQAIRRANEGERLLLAFNGAYIPVRKGCNVNKIVDIYDAFIEKQKENPWSEEDEAIVKTMCEEGDLKPSERAWLMNLKNRKWKESLHIEEMCKENPDSFTDACKDVIVAIEKYLDWLTGYPDYAPKGKYSIRDMLYCLNIIEKQKEQSLRDYIDDFPYSDQQEQKPVERATMRDFNYHEGEPDEKAWSRLFAILNYAEATSDDTPGEEVQALINWIEGKQKPAWSEEDEEMLNSIIATCKLAQEERDSSPARHLFKKQERWLKSHYSNVKSEKPSEGFDGEFSKFSNDVDAEHPFPICVDEYKDFARHFYELGKNSLK